MTGYLFIFKLASLLGFFFLVVSTWILIAKVPYFSYLNRAKENTFDITFSVYQLIENQQYS
jgi:hypothetical protein